MAGVIKNGAAVELHSLNIHILGNYVSYIPTNLHTDTRIHQIFSLTVFLQRRSRKTVRFSEQIMSADKNPSIFSRQMESIVYIFSHCLYNNMKIPKY